MEKKNIIPLNKIKWSIFLEYRGDLAIFVQCIEKLVASVDPKRTEILFLGNQDNPLVLNTFSHFCEKANIPYNYGDDREHALSIAKGMYVLFLSDHTIVSKNFLVRLTYCMENYDKESKTAIVAPISNEVSSELAITPQNIDALQVALTNQQTTWNYTLNLPLFCVLAKKEALAPNQNVKESILQANYDGYFTVSANDTIVYHFSEEIDDRISKGFLDINEPKFAILYRVKIDDEYMRDVFVQSLAKSTQVTENVYVLDDNSKVKLSLFFKENQGELWAKVKKYEKFSRPYDEKRDFNQLLDWAEEDGCNWVMILEGDEILENKVTSEFISRFISPPNPQVFGYKVNHYYFYNSSTQWRVDKPWGKMDDIRFSRLFPGRRMVKPGVTAFQFGFVPDIPQENVRETGIRIKNYGYARPEHREKKREFYEKLGLSGVDFSYITSINGMHRYPWVEDADVTFYTPVKNGGPILWSWLDRNAYFADQVLIGNDENLLPDSDVEDIKRYKNTRIVPTVMADDYGEGRNKIIEKVDTEWVMQLDIDEVVEGLCPLRRVLDIPGVDSWMFSITNVQKDGGQLNTETMRLFKNKEGVQYWGRLHETIDAHVKKYNWKVSKSPVKLTHYGYTLQSPDEAFKKMQKYLAINIKQMKENPMHGMAYYSVALHFLEDDLVDDGIKLLEICSMLQPGFPLCGLELAKCHIRKAKKWMDNTFRMLGENHPLRQAFAYTNDTLARIMPKNHIVAKGHCLNYFSIHNNEREWLRKHIMDMEKKIEEQKTKLLEKQSKRA